MDGEFVARYRPLSARQDRKNVIRRGWRGAEYVMTERQTDGRTDGRTRKTSNAGDTTDGAFIHVQSYLFQALAAACRVSCVGRTTTDNKMLSACSTSGQHGPVRHTELSLLDRTTQTVATHDAGRHRA